MRESAVDVERWPSFHRNYGKLPPALITLVFQVLKATYRQRAAAVISYNEADRENFQSTSVACVCVRALLASGKPLLASHTAIFTRRSFLPALFLGNKKSYVHAKRVETLSRARYLRFPGERKARMHPAGL